MNDLIIGAHVEQSDAITEATDRGTTIAQIFLGNPQSYKGPALTYEGGIAALREDARAAGIGLYVHAPYVINVATGNNRVRIPSRKLLQQHVTAAAELGALGVIVHGGQMGKDGDLDAGFDNWRKAIDGLKAEVPVLIENTAGGDNAPARQLENIDRLWAAVQAAKGADMVGFCLDTCHAHAAGADLTGVVERVRAVTGRIDLIHLNDSRDANGSGADRHTSLGQGQCDPDGLVDVVRSAGAPVILETPGDAAQHRADIDWLRQRLAAPIA
ncbi:deoxyribonuclease IV [Nigerium massiliense]|uniref:deoxyribonuclease IV n=1 Tax=Nigerium massiliense TaxID=1522317 RepID=UPI00058D5A72|nr:deoxyribonuclease IV [Nigerium massiliense]